MNPADTRWIAVDWGTSNLRCWAISSDDNVLASANSGQGMAAIAAGSGDFESALLDLIHPWLKEDQPAPVIACGMVGARQGWIEVPYEQAPCSPQTTLTPAPAKHPQLEVSILAGVSQDHPADVMRGEETQIAGLLANHPGFEGLVCLPGTHTKWVQLRDGKIQSFRTFLTGELFTLLSEQSVLRHNVSTDGFEEAPFLDALHSALDNPADLLAQCFTLRAESLLHNLDGVTARSRLSGILLGGELAGALAHFSSVESVSLVGASTTTKIYESALDAVGLNAIVHPAEDTTLAGLAAAAEALGS